MHVSQRRIASVLTFLAACLSLLGAGASSADAQRVSGRWVVKQAALRYAVDHLMHGAVGRSQNAQGIVACDSEQCRFTLTAPVGSFSSGNVERDADLRALLDVERFPTVTVTGSGRLVEPGQAVVSGVVTLAGRTARIAPARFQVERGWWTLRVQGSFPLSLSELGLPAPTLLGIPISDVVRIGVELELGGE